ncbi:MAG TPA: pitrilysin family protein [Deinococcales bacterium]|nr:pitrilysin family protein [Deinococcales bacterium]
MIVETTFENGLRVVLEPQPWLPTVAFKIRLNAGAVTEPEDLSGLGAVLEEWSHRGAGGRPSRELADVLDAFGVQRSGGPGMEGLSFGASCLTDDLNSVLPLFADIVLRPNLTDDEFEPARDLIRQDLEGQDDNPPQKLFTRLRRAFFVSPHGRNVLGTRETLERLNPRLAREDRERRFSPEGATISLAGGVDAEAAIGALRTLFGGWRGEAVPRPVPVARSGFYEHLPDGGAQEQIALIYPDVPPGAPGWFESRLAVNLLSNVGFSSRLVQKVREERGLAYSVSASSSVFRGGSALTVHAATAPERAQEALDVMLDEMNRLSEGVTPAELDRSRISLRTSLVMSGESAASRAAALASDLNLYGHPRELHEVLQALEQVQLDGLNAFLAARPYANPAIMTLGSREVAPPSLVPQVVPAGETMTDGRAAFTLGGGS